MNRWQVLRALFKQISIYPKQLIFFVIIVVLAACGYMLWDNFGKIEAAVQYGDLAYIPQLVETNIVVGEDGQVFVNGKRHNRAVRYYEKYDELRVLLFDEPGTYIPNLKVKVSLPKPFPEQSVRQIIYAVHGTGSYQTYISDSQTLYYHVADISPQATVTIVADLPKGLLQPGPLQKLRSDLANLTIGTWLYLAITLPGITCIIMIFMLLRRRSDYNIMVSGILARPPRGAHPAIPGVLVDGLVGAREIAATLIDLARRGYIVIVNDGNGNFSFAKRKLADPATTPGLEPYERALLSKIFFPQFYKSTLSDVEMRIGRHIFSKKIANFYLSVYNQATESGYFTKNPAKVHIAYKYTGIILFFLSFVFFVYGAVGSIDPKYSLVFWVGGMIAAGVIIKFAPYMPVRTVKGLNELKDWLAFKEYLKMSKPIRGREFLQGQFEEFLPYAIVLGAEAEWVNRFMAEPFTRPEWYESNEVAVTLESFAGQLFPLIGYVANNLAKSHDPTVE